MDNTQATSILRQLIEAQDEAQAAVPMIEDRRTRERLELLISRAQLRARELQQWLGGPVSGSMTSTAAPAATSSQDFAQLLSAIKAKWPDRERLTMIRDMGRAGHYTSAQVGSILKIFDFDTDRIEAAVLLYPKLSDPENFYQAVEAFDSPFKQKEVRERLGL